MILTRTLSKDEIVYFMHVPKTAGVSLTTVLASYFSEEEFHPSRSAQYLKQCKKAELQAYRCFHGHFICLPLGEYLPKPPTCRVTILREPLRRTASHYRHLQVERRSPHYYDANSLDLGTFLNDPDARGAVTDLQTRFLAWESLGRIDGVEDEELLQAAKTELASFEFFGVTERFEESLLLMAFQLGLEPPVAVPRVNCRDANGDKDTLSTGQLVELFSKTLQDANKVDLALYSYATDTFQQRYRQMLEVLSEGRPDRLAGNPQATRRALCKWLKALKRTKNCRYKIVRQTARAADPGEPKRSTDNAPGPLNVRSSATEEHSRRPETLSIDIQTIIEQPAGHCGWFDQIALSKDGTTVQVRGWAYDPTELRPAEEILIVAGSSKIRSRLEKSGDDVCLQASSIECPAHRIIAHGKVNQPRDDVVERLREIGVPLMDTNNKYGWEAKFDIRLLEKADTSLRAYAYFPKRRMILRIGSELEIPRAWEKKIARQAAA